MNNYTVLIYYIYTLTVLILTGYVVFILDHSGAWFILAALFLDNSPTTKK